MSVRNVARNSPERTSSPHSHALRHTGIKNYECEERGKKFTTKGTHTHILNHSGVMNYKWAECGKGFPAIGALLDRDTHTFRHTGLREFKCDVCGKCFKTKTDIANHRKIDTLLRWWCVCVWWIESVLWVLCFHHCFYYNGAIYNHLTPSLLFASSFLNNWSLYNIFTRSIVTWNL